MPQSQVSYNFLEVTEIPDIAKFNEVLQIATQAVEDMKSLTLNRMILVCAKNNGRVDFDNIYFIDFVRSQLDTEPNAARTARNDFYTVITQTVEQAEKYNLGKENTDKLLTEIKTNINNFKNMLLSNEAETELLLARHKINKLIENNIVARDSDANAKFVDVEKDLGKKIAKYINVSSAPSIIKIDNSRLKFAINEHLASFIPESDIQASRTQFTEEQIRDTASFISSLYEVFDRRDNIAVTFYKSAKNGVNKVKEICRDKKHAPAILSNLFSSVQDKDSRFDLEHIGLYLSDAGDENKKTLEHFTALHDFNNKNFLDSLRIYLQSFKLPGEAQKIDRIVEAFGKEYVKQNPHSEVGSSDNAYVLAFATIMLSTDLHNTHKNFNKMTAEQFKKSLRGLKNNQDFDNAFLDQLYNSIKNDRLRYDLVTEPPGYEVRTSELIKDNTYNKLSDYLNNFNSTAKDIFPNLQDADKWQIVSQAPKSWLSKFMGYRGSIVLSNKEKGDENVTIQIYEPSILSQWFLAKKHRVIIQPTRGAIKAAATMAASIKLEVTSVKGTYNYEKEDLQAEYINAKSMMANAHSIPPNVQDIIMNNAEVIKKHLYKGNIIEDNAAGNRDFKRRFNTRKYYLNPKQNSSDRGV